MASFVRAVANDEMGMKIDSAGIVMGIRIPTREWEGMGIKRPLSPISLLSCLRRYS